MNPESIEDTYGARFANIVHDQTASSTKATASGHSADSTSQDEAAEATIQNPLRAETAESLQAARNADEAISTIQELEKAVFSIERLLVQMGELTEQLGRGNDAGGQMTMLHEELKNLALGVNKIVETTEYNGNRLLSADGQAISIAIGDGSAIDIAASDLSIEADKPGLLERIKEEIKIINSYAGFLIGVKKKIENITTTMQFGLPDVVKVEEHMQQARDMLEVEVFSLRRITEEAYRALRGQANVEPDSAARLLEPVTSVNTPEEEETTHADSA